MMKNRITIRLNDIEQEKLCSLTKKYSVNYSDAIRRKLMLQEKSFLTIEEQTLLTDNTFSLRKIGVQLNQILKNFYTTKDNHDSAETMSIRGSQQYLIVMIETARLPPD